MTDAAVPQGDTKLDFQTRTGPVKVNVPTREGLMVEIEGRLRRREGFAVATLNLDHLVKLDRSSAFLRAYRAQDFVVADGNPVVWLSRFAGSPLELVPGADLVVPLARFAVRLNAPIAFVGSTQSSLDDAAQQLMELAPGLEVAAKIAPPMGFDPAGDSATAVIDAVSASGARICLLALGAPKQELLAAHGRESAPEMGFVSIGAGLDFLSGRQRRAPAWVRAMALEWAWRAATQPLRLGPRYARCAAILPRHTLRALSARFSR